MKPCNPGVETEVTSTVTGEAVSIRVTQTPADPGGWWLDIYAESPEGGWYFVRTVAIPKPFRRRSRIVCRIVEPGAMGWKAIVSPPTAATKATGAMRVALDSCPKEFATEHEFVTKGLSYASGAAPAAVVLPPAARAQEISAIAGPGGATLQVLVQRSATETELLPIVPIPAGTPFSFEKDELDGSYIATATFAGDLAGYVVAWVE